MFTKTIEYQVDIPHFGSIDKSHIAIPPKSKVLKVETVERWKAAHFFGNVVKVQVTVGRWFAFR